VGHRQRDNPQKRSSERGFTSSSPLTTVGIGASARLAWEVTPIGFVHPIGWHVECPRIVSTDLNDLICKIFLLRARGKGDGFPVFLLRGKDLGLREDEFGMRVHRQVRENALTPACRGRRSGMRVRWVKLINPPR
jgi:hypothetical protein